uniref:Protein phosphatase 2C-related protein n=1 Tax=Hirondellea gigas TaxID=1518452 RepID=A0A6A7GA39_9CRUS
MPSINATTEALKKALKELEENCIVDVKEGLETLTIYIDNIISNPKDQRFRKIRVSNVNYQDRLGHLKGGQILLETIGFCEDKQFLILPEDLYKEDQTMIKAIADTVGKHRDACTQKFNDVVRTPLNHCWKSVAHVAFQDDIGERTYMEDDHIALDSFCGLETMGFYGLYDGHGGRQTVDFVVKSFHKNLEHHLRHHPDDPMDSVFEQCYLRTDSQVSRMDILQSGTTAVTGLTRMENDRKILYVANCGDSRAVLCRNGTAVRLSRDHKPQDPEEQKRIIAAGGFIGRFDRVNGILAVSRAIGDHMLKPAVSAEPTVSRTELTSADRFLILACDGLWDVMSDQEACDFVLSDLKERLESKATDTTEESESSPASHSPVTPAVNSTQANQCESSPVASKSSSAKPRISSPDFSLDHIRSHLYPVSKALVKAALDKRSLDNVTVMIVWF